MRNEMILLPPRRVLDLIPLASLASSCKGIDAHEQIAHESTLGILSTL